MATLTDADLSDEAIFAVDADPALLTRRLREGSAARIHAAGLGEAATAFYHRVLEVPTGGARARRRAVELRVATCRCESGPAPAP